MERCRHCNCAIVPRTSTSWTKHKLGCPTVIPAFKKLWDEGWGDGYQSRKEALDHPTYLMGYGVGIVSGEEAENGWNPRWND